MYLKKISRFSKMHYPDERKHLSKKLAKPYEYFKNNEYYQKPVNNLKKKDFFSEVKTLILVLKK